jgi:hypothetical protein
LGVLLVLLVLLQMLEVQVVQTPPSHLLLALVVLLGAAYIPTVSPLPFRLQAGSAFVDDQYPPPAVTQ